MLWFEDAFFRAWEREERRKQRLGVTRYQPTTADFRRLLPPMDPAIIPRLKANAKLGIKYQINKETEQ